MNGIDRPLDLLNQAKGLEVIVTLRDGKEVEGILLAFDLTINIVLDMKGKLRFIRGDNVLYIDKKEGEDD